MQHRYILASPQKVVCRLLSQQISRIPLDAERLSSVVTKDVTVFTYSNKRYFLLISLFGGMQLLFWANLASFAISDPTVQNSVTNDTKLQKNYSSWMDKFYAENRNKIGVSFLALGTQLQYIAMFSKFF